MEINYLTVVATMINFIILVLIVTKFLFKPVNNVITVRENEISDRIQKSEDDEKKAELLRVQREKELKDAKSEGKGIVEEFKHKAEKVSEDIIGDAKSEADQLMERAKKETEREKQKAEEEIKAQAIELAIMLSSKALETTIDEAQHRRLIEDFIAKVGI
ncbi:F0F1 ATP synthase subunit B [Clostridium omnivorum]|uniref:ATP synthase subunit b n=1 Tax=Clostridium omnivorum TaxID=1604902 RepID=A0ABQ5N0L9_9CLOT|nr:F0F1 ATP synthase subunit B [Clostridium sp. E14]GLC28753.1 ATP synthase subunit b [Clostridium sp. E14]